MNLVILILLGVVLWLAFGQKEKTVKISYNFMEFEVDKKNPEYSQEQAKAIEKIIMGIKCPDTFKNFNEYINFFPRYDVPGYRTYSLGIGTSTELGYFSTYSIEIPFGKKFRVFVYFSSFEENAYHYICDYIIQTDEAPETEFLVTGNEVTVVDDAGPETVSITKTIK